MEEIRSRGLLPCITLRGTSQRHPKYTILDFYLWSSTQKSFWQRTQDAALHCDQSHRDCPPLHPPTRPFLWFKLKANSWNSKNYVNKHPGPGPSHEQTLPPARGLDAEVQEGWVLPGFEGANTSSASPEESAL